MPRSPIKRVFGSLRRLLRRRRAPGPSEQEWLRLILLVRRMQRGQLAVAQRLDEIRALTGAMGSFRSDFGSLHEQLGAARDSASELERGLSERLEKLDALPDALEERAALDQRIGQLDTLAGRLETLAAQAPSGQALASELSSMVARFGELAARIESAHEAERTVGGQDELARLYERIQELAEVVARAPAAAGTSSEAAGVLEDHFTRFGERLAGLEDALQILGSDKGQTAQGKSLARLERLIARFERKGGMRVGRTSVVPPEELIPLLARVEALVVRLDQLPVALPELPLNSVAGGGGADAETQRQLEELRIQVACAEESHRRLEGEFEVGRERLRASELARVELETRHASELTQMADHVGRQLQRVEDDLKKKKRGLAELTQQNIALQNQVVRLRGASEARSAEPPPALPSAGHRSPSGLLESESEVEGSPDGQSSG